jgi:RNA polymerase sigma-70 factor (ECF subfamily)
MALIGDFFRRPPPAEIVAEHGPAVLAQLRRTFGPRADVDDVFQAVFVEVLRSLPRFRGHSSLRTWIHRITLNVAYQEMRLQYRARATTSLEEADEPRSDQDLEADLEQKEAGRRLYEALEDLDPKKRMAVVLHDIEGLTLKEIGRQLGRPLQTVATQVRTGRAELAERLTERRQQQPAVTNVRRIR